MSMLQRLRGSKMRDDRNYKGNSQNPEVPSKEKLFKSMMIKGIIGALIIVGSLEELFSDMTAFLGGLVIGAGLIIWGVVPYMEYKKKEKDEEVEHILSTPINKLQEEDEAERLARKYYSDK